MTRVDQQRDMAEFAIHALRLEREEKRLDVYGLRRLWREREGCDTLGASKPEALKGARVSANFYCRAPKSRFAGRGSPEEDVRAGVRRDDQRGALEKPLAPTSIGAVQR